MSPAGAFFIPKTMKVRKNNEKAYRKEKRFKGTAYRYAR